VTPIQRNSTSVGHDPLGGLEVAGSKVTGSEVTGLEVTMRSLCRLEVARLKSPGQSKVTGLEVVIRSADYRSRSQRAPGQSEVTGSAVTIRSLCRLEVARLKVTGSVRGHRVGGHDPLALSVRGRAVKGHWVSQRSQGRRSRSARSAG